MRKTFIEKLITPNIFTIFLLFFCYAGVWAFTFFTGGKVVDEIEHFSPAAQFLQSFFGQDELIPSLLSFFICILNIFLLIALNNRFTLIRTRTILPVIVFLMLICGSQYPQTLFLNHFALTLFIVSLFFFFNTYRDPKAVEQAYMGSFLIACTSIIVPHYMLMIIACWITFFDYKAFSARTFLASVFGLLTPLILYFSCLFLVNGTVDFQQYLTYFLPYETIFNKGNLPLGTVYQVIMFLFFVPCAITVYLHFNKDVIHTRKNLNFCFFILLFSIVLRAFYVNSYISLMPLTMLGYAVFLSHTFTLIQTKFWQIVFVLFCLINILFIFY